MTHQPHSLSNLNFALKYFETLPADDVSRRYAAGEKYASGWASRLKFFFSIDSILGELNRFYPYQPVVNKTHEMYKEKRDGYRQNALLFSGISIFTVYQLAKQNIVLPFFKKFGRMKTHRLLRQYLALAFLPYLFADGFSNYFFLGQTEKLWAVHSERLNNGILSDPVDSQYPIKILPENQIHSYVTPNIHPYDLKKKLANEVDIMLAPDYQNIEEWEKAPLKEPSDDEEEGEGEEGQSGGEDDE